MEFFESNMVKRNGNVVSISSHYFRWLNTMIKLNNYSKNNKKSNNNSTFNDFFRKISTIQVLMTNLPFFLNNSISLLTCWTSEIKWCVNFLLMPFYFLNFISLLFSSLPCLALPCLATTSLSNTHFIWS